MPSFYTNFNEHDLLIEIKEAECHHIINVFRHKIGDIISLTNGKGLITKGEIVEINKKSLKVKPIGVTLTVPNERKIACAFSLLKNKHDLLIVEKLTELGVNDLFPLITTNSVKLSQKNTLDKMKLTSIAAIKQCNNPWLPNIHPVSILKKSLDFITNKNYIPLIASEIYIEKRLPAILQLDKYKNKNICVFIGPEGGFTEAEFAFFTDNNIEMFSLGRNILKADTAAICAVSQVIYHLDGTDSSVPL